MHSATSVLRAIRPGANRAGHPAKLRTREPPLHPFRDGQEPPLRPFVTVAHRYPVK